MANLAVNGTSKPNGTLTNGDARSAKAPRPRTSSSYAAKFNLAPHFIGGNHLDVAPAGSVKDFVANNDGHTVISSVCPLARSFSALMHLSLADQISRFSLPTTELPQ